VTSYAKLVLNLSSSLGFVSRFREYFCEHDAFRLPFEFRARIGELFGCKLISATIDHLNKTTEMFLQAKERIDAVILGTVAFIDILRQRSQEGVKIRWLMQESFIPDAPSALSSWKKLPEIRTTPLALGYIVVTDKAASLSIRQNDGAMSYSSFYGEDPSSIKWTQELFNHEFERASPWRP
jgi:predicted transcriptional regulator